MLARCAAWATNGYAGAARLDVPPSSVCFHEMVPLRWQSPTDLNSPMALRGEGAGGSWFAVRKRDASDRDLDPKVGCHVPQEAGSHQARYDLGCLLCVETEPAADLFAQDLDIEAAAAPVVDAAHKLAIPV